MTNIQTTGKDEKLFNFMYESEERYDCLEEKTKIHFLIHSTDEDYEDYFDFKIAVLEENIIKVTDMFLDSKQKFKGRGIPAAMIFETQRLYPDCQIISSSNNEKFRKMLGEWRSLDGSKVWERLVREGFATYNAAEDVYYLTR